jgi:hypothetical protein
VHLVGIIYYNIITIHGPINIKVKTYYFVIAEIALRELKAYLQMVKMYLEQTLHVCSDDMPQDNVCTDDMPQNNIYTDDIPQHNICTDETPHYVCSEYTPQYVCI